ncbi:hypothetical protein VNI00_006719 [Paramarasmius palmivorus]|uniref:Uncharacterized protein n=1 Tax=Paramarasmius palmivorus TaxID=297713 RepID=A0AAW0D8P7_9AGAR
MGRIQDIPLELAQKIIVEEACSLVLDPEDKLDKKTQQVLRFLNKHTRSVVDPILFSHIQLHISPVAERLVESLSKNEDEGRIANSVRSLELDLSTPGSVCEHIVGFQETLRCHLGAALKTMVNLQTLKLVMNATIGGDWVYRMIFSSLGTLDSLADLDYCHEYDTDSSIVPFQHIRNLRRIKVTSRAYDMEERIVKPLSSALGNSPSLTDITLELEDHHIPRGDPPRLDTLFSNSPQDTPLKVERLHLEGVVDSLPLLYTSHFRSLKSITITTRDEPSPEPQKVVVNGVTEDLLRYLSSYSGLQELELSFQEHPETDTENSEQWSQMLYDMAIPRHSESLKTLSLPKTDETHWCVGVDNVAHLGQCPNMISVHLMLNNDDLGEPNSEEDILTKLLNLAVRMEKLEEVDIEFPVAQSMEMLLALAMQWHENISLVRCKHRRQRSAAALCVRFAGQVFELKDDEEKDGYSMFVPTIPIPGDDD